MIKAHDRGMNCFVTGASGFIGANMVHELVARGHRVKALLRPGADLRGLAGAGFERVEGDVSDRGRLEKSMRECDWCFHVAASYHLWLRDYRPMYAANVQGTRNVLEVAAAAGCQRIVYTSTVGCIGLPNAINGQIIPTDESSPAAESQMSNHYKRSKWQAEQVALELARKVSRSDATVSASDAAARNIEGVRTAAGDSSSAIHGSGSATEPKPISLPSCR